MGAAASAPQGPLDAAACIALAGDRFDPAAFAALAVEGKEEDDGQATITLGQMLDHFERQGWVDPSFDRSVALRGCRFLASAKCSGAGAPPPVYWKCDGSLSAVADDVVYADAKQGHEGDCFLVAAMALLAGRGAAALRTVVRAGAQPGQWIVRLWRCGEPVETTVDGLLPWIAAWGSPLYTHCRRRAQACFGAIEKAFVVLAGGSYHNLDGGNTAEALYTLTGCAVEELDVPKQKLGAHELGAAVGTAIARGDLVACGHVDTDATRKMTRLPLGVRRNHAFAVVAASPKDGVTLYNPMGIDDDIDAKLQPNGAGSFRMTWTQFAATFNRVQLCALSSREALPASSARAPATLARWAKKKEGDGSGSAGGCTNFTSFHSNPMLLLPPPLVAALAKEGCELEVQLGQADQRAAAAAAQWDEAARADEQSGTSAAAAVMAASLGSKLDYPQLGLTLIAFVGSGAVPPMATPENIAVVAKSRAFLNRREVSLRFSIAEAAAAAAAAASGNKSGHADSGPFHMAVVPSTFYAGQEAAFWCTVRSARAIPCEEEGTEVVGTLPADKACWRCMCNAPTAHWEGRSAGNTCWLRPLVMSGDGGGGGGGGQELTIFVRQAEEQREKQLPISAWVLLQPPDGADGPAKTLSSPAKGCGKGFVKATQISLRVTVPAGHSLSDVVVVPVTFDASSDVKLFVTLVCDGIAAGELAVSAAVGSNPAKMGIGVKQQQRQQGGTLVKGGRRSSGAGAGKKRAGGAKQPKPNFGKAKANINAMADMFAGLE